MMEATATLAGFFAAHAIWCVAEGETLIPLVAYESEGGERRMFRIERDRLEDSVEEGRAWLGQNPEGASRAVLVSDGYMALPSGKTDCLVLEAQVYRQQPRAFAAMVPYRHAKSPGGFAVHRPKFQARDGLKLDVVRLGEAFFEGVHAHPQGSAIWISRLDEGR